MDQVRILIAEDNELVALTLEEQVVSLGYAVAGVARNGKEAVQLCEQLMPDVILMDMQMPEMAGDAAAKQITQRCPRPIIMLTAFSDAEHIHRAEGAGALAYLVKPINPEELPATVDIVLARFQELDTLRHQVASLQDTIDANKLVERALGIWMKRLGVSHDEAKARMEKRAVERQVGVKEIAQAIVDAEALLS